MQKELEVFLNTRMAVETNKILIVCTGGHFRSRWLHQIKYGIIRYDKVSTNSRLSLPHRTIKQKQ